jgi:hypothetical protein
MTSDSLASIQGWLMSSCVVPSEECQAK